MNYPLDFEVLLSTMYRSDEGFLVPVFKEVDQADIPVLIVNQTDPDKHIRSSKSNVRAINTSDRGLPQSRNLAIENARGAICLVADDDVIYEPGFKEAILRAYQKHPDADVITFQMSDGAGNIYKETKQAHKHDVRSVSNVCGVVISFKPASLKEKGVIYDPHFGLGSTFASANEYVFMRNALDAGLNCYFEPDVIVVHPHESSGMQQGKDSIVFARAALRYKYHGNLAYLWLIKYLRFLWVKKYISFGEILPKFRTGIRGIKKYKTIRKSAD